jgi:hypothetical protein
MSQAAEAWNSSQTPLTPGQPDLIVVMISRQRHDATAGCAIRCVDQPEPGMRSSDRLGPWFDLDGSEIIPLGTEAVERVVERIIGAFQLWSNLPRSTAPAW